jgi:hypothetical protein
MRRDHGVWEFYLLFRRPFQYSEPCADRFSGVDVVSGQRLPFEKESRPQEDSDEDQSETSSEGGSDGGERRSRYELQLRLSNIIDILSNLYRLSFKIRNPNLKQQSLKGSLYQETDPETGIELFSRYLDFDRLYIIELVRELRIAASDHQEENEYLINRLTTALTDRRKYFSASMPTNSQLTLTPSGLQ